MARTVYIYISISISVCVYMCYGRTPCVGVFTLIALITLLYIHSYDNHWHLLYLGLKTMFTVHMPSHTRYSLWHDLPLFISSGLAGKTHKITTGHNLMSLPAQNTRQNENENENGNGNGNERKEREIISKSGLYHRLAMTGDTELPKG